jgi:hypothetical protein
MGLVELLVFLMENNRVFKSQDSGTEGLGSNPDPSSYKLVILAKLLTSLCPYFTINTR